jgi:hypothetical protein
VTSVVEPTIAAFAVPVGENELEVDSKSAAEVDGICVALEKVEGVEVVGMEVGEFDDNGGVEVEGVVLEGVDGNSVIDCTGNDIVLVFVVRTIVSREHKHILSW